MASRIMKHNSINRNRIKTSTSEHHTSLQPSLHASSSVSPNHRYMIEGRKKGESKLEPIRKSTGQYIVKDPQNKYLKHRTVELMELDEKKQEKNQRIREIYHPKKTISNLRYKAKKPIQQKLPQPLHPPKSPSKEPPPKQIITIYPRESNKAKPQIVKPHKASKTEKLTYCSFYQNYEEVLKKQRQSKQTQESEVKIREYQPNSDLMKSVNLDKFVVKGCEEGMYYGQLNEHGERKGKGIIFYENGKIYEGEFCADMKEGQGTETYPDGSCYKGDFRRGVKCGRGRYEWGNGELYDGQWQNNVKHGSGLWQAKDGSSYIGEWQKGIISGFGVLTNSTGERYEGQFRDFCREGKGTYRFKNGQVYVGMFHKNKPNGEGQYYWINGDYYKGNFVNGLRHGSGILNSNSGQYVGEFRNDKRCGLGEETYDDGVTYVGNYQNDLRHGFGKILCDNVVYYEGYWLNNQAVDIEQNNQMTIFEDEREFINSVLENDRSQKSLKKKSPEKKKQRMKKVIKNTQKYKKTRVQRTSSLNVLERLYQPGKKMCKCGLKHA